MRCYFILHSTASNSVGCVLSVFFCPFFKKNLKPMRRENIIILRQMPCEFQRYVPIVIFCLVYSFLVRVTCKIAKLYIETIRYLL